jgi:hypothetical protein
VTCKNLIVGSYFLFLVNNNTVILKIVIKYIIYKSRKDAKEVSVQFGMLLLITSFLVCL